MRIICTNAITGNLLIAAFQTKPALVAVSLGAAILSAVVLVANELTERLIGGDK